MKYSDSQLLLMEPEEVFLLRLNDKIERFPRGFIKEGEYINYDVAIKIFKYLFEEYLKLTDEQIKEELSINFFKKYKVHVILKIAFDSSPYKAIETVYPGRFKPWELKCSPNGYWNLETAKEATRWLIEEKLKWDDDDIKKKLSLEIFHRNNLSGMISLVFSSSPYYAINAIYPNRFKPWELSNTTMGFWNLETAKDATKWLIEEKLKWDDEDIKNKISKKVFIEYGLGSMLKKFFECSSYEALENAYPGRFKPWEFKFCPKNFWNKETGKQSLKWLFEEKLKLTPEEIIKVYDKKLLIDNGLYGMIRCAFDNDLFEAINYTYPGRYKIWQLKHIVRNYWTKETAKEAFKFVIEEELKLSDEEICSKITLDFMKKHNLYGILCICFDGSCFNAIDYIYPGKFIKTLNGRISQKIY